MFNMLARAACAPICNRHRIARIPCGVVLQGVRFAMHSLSSPVNRRVSDYRLGAGTTRVHDAHRQQAGWRKPRDQL